LRARAKPPQPFHHPLRQVVLAQSRNEENAALLRREVQIIVVDERDDLGPLTRNSDRRAKRAVDAPIRVGRRTEREQHREPWKRHVVRALFSR
jgi:hypothetical protein